MSAKLKIDPFTSLKDQKQPDFVCNPGDLRVKKYGWQKSKFQGYISLEGDVIFISAIWSKQCGKGHFSRLVKNLHKAGFTIKVPNPFEHMEAICEHLGFKRTTELFPEAGEDITVYVLEHD